MKKTFGFVMFTIGAATGSLVTWQLLKRKYERIVQEEIQSIKEAFKNKPVEPVVEEEPKVSLEEVKKYNHIIAEQGYNTVQNDVVEDDGFESVEEEAEGDTESIQEVTYQKPFAITPEDFASGEDYEVETLTYFGGDKVLANQYGEVVDIDSIGQNNLDRIGEYEDDCIHVRDISIKTDFEILLDPRKYSEVYKERE